FTFAVLSLAALDSNVSAQAKIVEPQIQRDPILEADSKKNIEAARLYFTTKKAYKAVLMRCDEIIAANPDYSRMDEVLYLVGMSELYLSQGKGKQKIDLTKLSAEDKVKFAPERLREDAIANLSILVEKYPNSDFAKKAQTTLKDLGETPKK
ncbi:MAG: outer membrane protein assembly factor BamD, partial [Pyrinomonadaceae bacterium]|nr:outer membrane protein assembly factor BamD [Pyrinomonadaceae bacterium]